MREEWDGLQCGLTQQQSTLSPLFKKYLICTHRTMPLLSLSLRWVFVAAARCFMGDSLTRELRDVWARLTGGARASDISMGSMLTTVQIISTYQPCFC